MRTERKRGTIGVTEWGSEVSASSQAPPLRAPFLLSFTFYITVEKKRAYALTIRGKDNSAALTMTYDEMKILKIFFSFQLKVRTTLYLYFFVIRNKLKNR